MGGGVNVEDWYYKNEEFSTFGEFKRQIAALEAKNKKLKIRISSLRSDNGDGSGNDSSDVCEKMKVSSNRKGDILACQCKVQFK